MQEEVNEKTVSLCITGGKVTVRLLKQAMMRFLAAVEKEKAEKARKQQTKAPPDKEYHGKQSLKKLTQQNIQLSNIEITDNNIKAFETKKPSVRKKLQQAITARNQDKQREREKSKEKQKEPTL